MAESTTHSQSGGGSAAAGGAVLDRGAITIMSIMVLGLVFLAGLWWWTSQNRGGAANLPELGEISPFTFTDQDGRPFSSDELRGRVWVADFIFTSCAASCPVMTRKLKALQEELKRFPELIDRVKLVSFTVDPHNDTPEKLRTFARGYGADAEHWVFLTGNRDEVARLSNDSFLLAARSPAAGTGIPTHSDRFGLVDCNGQLRGLYRGTDDSILEDLFRDLRGLVGECPPADEEK